MIQRSSKIIAGNGHNVLERSLLKFRNVLNFAPFNPGERFRMIVRPKVRGFICTTAHSAGCAQNIKDQIEYVRRHGPINGPKRVLVIGASTGYGLASRIVSAFGSGASTIGVFFEKPAEGERTATAGWYNSAAFEVEARKAGLYSKSFNGDAFSDQIKAQVVQAIRKDLGQVDMVIYSLAAPRRVHPKTGERFKGVVKPLGKAFKNRALDLETFEIIDVTTEPGTEEERKQTVAVMGGEDWEMWIETLKKEGVLADKSLTLAYSYLGPDITFPIYRQGTLGAAKDHLEATAHKLDETLRPKGGRAFVSVQKALVTQASAAIPLMALYMVILLKVMRQKGVDEHCIQQIHRLYQDRLFSGREIPVDEKGRIRLDDLELRNDVQAEVKQSWEAITTENFKDYADISAYQNDFLRLFGFEVPGIDYEKDVEVDVPIP